MGVSEIITFVNVSSFSKNALSQLGQNRWNIFLRGYNQIASIGNGSCNQLIRYNFIDSVIKRAPHIKQKYCMLSRQHFCIIGLHCADLHFLLCVSLANGLSVVWGEMNTMLFFRTISLWIKVSEIGLKIWRQTNSSV